MGFSSAGKRCGLKWRILLCIRMRMIAVGYCRGFRVKVYRGY